MFGSTSRGCAALLTLAIASPWSASCIDDGPAVALDPGTVVVLNDNGAWCWFQDERAIVDVAAGRLLVGSVADDSGSGGTARDGDIDVVAYDLRTGTTSRTTLHPHLGGDDHNAPALHVRADGRYVAMYSAHADDDLTRWRVTSPADRSRWAPEQRLRHDAPVTYSNIVATGDDELVGFVRGADLDPHVITSGDDGATWQRRGRLLAGPGRPYVRYAAAPDGRVHLITTEQHPDAAPTSIYHGIVDGLRLTATSGAVLDADLADEDAVAPDLLSPVYLARPGERAWAIDLEVDADGRGYAALSVRRGGVNTYLYARQAPDGWHVHRLAAAGSSLYAGEPHYTGLVALDPNDPSRVVVSTDVDPVAGTPLISGRDGRQHHELFAGRTADDGATWTWAAITADSDADNLRPLIPRWPGDDTALLWLRGAYRDYRDYDLDVVALVPWADRPD
jgi:hypothetical protein